MGFDKQLLTLNDRYLFEHNLSVLRTEFEDIVAVTSTPQLYEGTGIRTVADVFPHMGPLAGLHAALLASESRYVYLTACDMPLPPHSFSGFVRLLRNHLTAHPAHGAWACPGGKVQTFHAFYSTRLAEPAQEVLAACSRKQDTPPGIYGFLKQGGFSLTTLPEKELLLADPARKLFTNLNTPEEYRAFCLQQKSEISGSTPSR